MFLSTAKNMNSLTFYNYEHWVKAVPNMNSFSRVYFKVVGKVLKLKLSKIDFKNFKTKKVTNFKNIYYQRGIVHSITEVNFARQCFFTWL